MRRLVFSASAQRDFIEIATFITRRSGVPRVGRAFVARLRDRCARFAELPGTIGVARPQLGQDARVMFHDNYVVVFRYEPNRIFVLRVIEGHCDLNSPPGARNT